EFRRVLFRSLLTAAEKQTTGTIEVADVAGAKPAVRHDVAARLPRMVVGVEKARTAERRLAQLRPEAHVVEAKTIGGQHAAHRFGMRPGEIHIDARQADFDDAQTLRER